MRETTEYPHFDEIIEQCKEKMKMKAKQYGNSWVGYHDWNFWMNRLQDEVDEIWNTAETKQFRKEIIDAINILCMIYDNAEHWHWLHNLQATETQDGSV